MEVDFGQMEQQKIFNVPGVVLFLIVTFAIIYGLRAILPEDQAIWLLIASAFIPARYSGLAGEIPGGEVASVTSFVTHIFTHADIMHLLINSAWLLAFGSVLARRLGVVRFLSFILAGGAAGALAYLLLHPDQLSPVVGASGAISAQMAAVLRFLFPAIDMREGYLVRGNPAAIPAMSVRDVFGDRRMVLVTMAFIAINLFALLGFGAPGSSGGIAWEAHVGGYLFGLLVFGIFDIAPQNQAPIVFEQDE